MKWTKLMFGRHYRKTLPEVVFRDSDWFFWAYQIGVLEINGMQEEAELVSGRATRIRIPQQLGEKLVAEYAFCCIGGKFANVEIVPESRRLHQGSSATIRLPFFDLSVPRRYGPYDKSGSRKLVASVKLHVFGSRSCHLTKERCESFFEDDSNFVF
ncbi:MAG TPA: hypothetical protein VGR14_19400 [Verrucomicrobiae bacterium]|jgi:hypothetical protein|nr:hypothetical protein [Verrucomicrobiae bacterium]